MVLNVACVQHSILPTEAFFTLMVTAFVLNVLVPVTITRWRPYYLEATRSRTWHEGGTGSD